jgi:hypothetical protein
MLNLRKVKSGSPGAISLLIGRQNSRLLLPNSESIPPAASMIQARHSYSLAYVWWLDVVFMAASWLLLIEQEGEAAGQSVPVVFV